ncbi:hypothetical protein FNV43_RR10164 [Rhamnella rubrinervis]|uniref:Uncharacterized protein n=1 Tax=Rhamnella rubrinervis TaxID=2594499 RepID=A0A8K0MKG1_9ROSA|nr:hypothetical protein FNV43_RR10164 [Rhamnella rubrinervis]
MVVVEVVPELGVPVDMEVEVEKEVLKDMVGVKQVDKVVVEVMREGKVVVMGVGKEVVVAIEEEEEEKEGEVAAVKVVVVVEEHRERTMTMEKGPVRVTVQVVVHADVVMEKVVVHADMVKEKVVTGGLSMICSVQQFGTTTNGSEIFFRHKSRALIERSLLLSSLPVQKAQRSAISVQKALHVSINFGSLKGRKSLIKCEAYKADRSKPIESNIELPKPAAPSEAAKKVKDRCVFCYVVGVECGVQYLQQEGSECVPIPLVDLNFVSGLWVFDYVDLLDTTRIT